MDEQNIPVCEPLTTAGVASSDAEGTYVDVDIGGDEREEQPNRKSDFVMFEKWGRRELLQPGMVTMAVLPSCKVALSTAIPSTASASVSDPSSDVEPVMHYAQRYCVVISFLEATTVAAGTTQPDVGTGDTCSDKVVVFDGMSHHVVECSSCSLIIPPLITSPSSVTPLDSNSHQNEIKEINMEEIWHENILPEEIVSNLSQVDMILTPYVVGFSSYAVAFDNGLFSGYSRATDGRGDRECVCGSMEGAPRGSAAVLSIHEETGP